MLNFEWRHCRQSGDHFSTFNNYGDTSQRKAIVVFFEKQAVLNNGFIYELLFGELRDDLEISADQHKKLLELCQDKYKKFGEQLIEIESDVLEKVGQCLEGENQVKFEDVAKWQPNWLYPSIFMLVRQDENGISRIGRGNERKKNKD